MWYTTVIEQFKWQYNGMAGAEAKIRGKGGAGVENK